MDLSDLRIFRSVVQEGGITRAAEKLHRVQSNVTTRVRQLEDALGVALFIRTGKKLTLSPAGAVLLDYADRLLDLAQEARDAVHDGIPRGPLRLGAMESAAAIRLPGPLAEFHRRYPEVNLGLHTANILKLMSDVAAGALDAAVVAEPIDDDVFEKAPIYDEELALVSAAGRPPIRSVDDVKNETILVFETGCPYRLRLQQWYAAAGALPARTVEMSSWHAIIGCTIASMGISVMPRAVLATVSPKFVSTYRLPKGLDHAPTALIWRRGARSPKIAALIEVLTDNPQKPPGKKKRPRANRR